MSDPCAPDVQNRLTKIETEMRASARALDVALDTMNRRLSEMNEFRSQIQQERQAFLTNKEFYAQYEAMRIRVEAGERWSSNMDGRLWMLGIGLMVLNSIIALGVSLLFHFWK